jgi:hypothetical protein
MIRPVSHDIPVPRFPLWHSRGTDEENQFDSAIGVLEETLMDQDFRSSLDAFLMQHCTHFENTDEVSTSIIFFDLYSH